MGGGRFRLLAATTLIIGAGGLAMTGVISRRSNASSTSTDDHPAPAVAPPISSAGVSGRHPDDSELYLDTIPADEWLGTDGRPLTGQRLRGEVVLLEFWTYLCYNCKNVEGWIKETHGEFGRRGLRVIGVHTPEFEVERDVANVREYVRANQIDYPVAIDNGWKVWRRYNATRAWPAFLVFDREGKLVYRRAGEGAVHGARSAIERALAVSVDRAGVPTRATTGVQISTRAFHSSPGRAELEIRLAAERGFRLVESPPSEIRLEPTPGVATPTVPIPLGEAFTGDNAGDVRYYSGEVTFRIPLPLERTRPAGPTLVRGILAYRVCDERAGTCSSRESEISAMVGARDGWRLNALTER